MFGANQVNLLDEVHNLSHPNPILSFHDMMLEFKQDRLRKKEQELLRMGGGATPTPRQVEQQTHLQHKPTISGYLMKKPSIAMDNLVVGNRPLLRKSSLLVSGNFLNDQLIPVRENSRQSISRSENGEVKINQYLIKELIGRGAFAQVKICENTETGETFAVKILEEHKMKKKMFSKDPNNKADQVIRGEIAILKKIYHPNIVRLIEIIEDEEYKRVYLIMEYCEKGCINKPNQNENLLQLSFGPKTLTEKEAKQHMRSLLLALDYLHNKANIAHRDIKPDNLLLSAENVLKLTDFGLSTESATSNNKSGTRAYMAPETYIEGQFDLKASDVWSLGITLYVLMTGKLPYPEEITDFELANIVQNKTFDFSLEIMSDHLKSFLHRCLERDPKKRATIRDLMSDVWITQGKAPLVNESLTLDFEITEDDKRNALLPKQNSGETQPHPRRKNYQLSLDIPS